MPTLRSVPNVSAWKETWLAGLPPQLARIARPDLESERGRELNLLPVLERAAVLSNEDFSQYLRARLFYTLGVTTCGGSDKLFTETVNALDPSIAAEIILSSRVKIKKVVKSGVDANWLAAFLNSPETAPRYAAYYMTASPGIAADIPYETSSLIFDSAELAPTKAGEIANIFPEFNSTGEGAKPLAFPDELRIIFAGMKRPERMDEILTFLSQETAPIMANILANSLE